MTTNLASSRRTSAARDVWELIGELVPYMRRHRVQAAMEAGLTVPQAHLLSRLDAAQSLSQRELAQRLGWHPSSVIEPLDRLQESGLVERRVSQNDRRINVVRLTDKGQAVHRQFRSLASTPPAALARLAPVDQSRIRDLLRQLLSELSGSDPHQH